MFADLLLIILGMVERKFLPLCQTRKELPCHAFIASLF